MESSRLMWREERCTLADEAECLVDGMRALLVRVLRRDVGLVTRTGHQQHEEHGAPQLPRVGPDWLRVRVNSTHLVQDLTARTSHGRYLTEKRYVLYCDWMHHKALGALAVLSEAAAD